MRLVIAYTLAGIFYGLAALLGLWFLFATAFTLRAVLLALGLA